MLIPVLGFPVASSTLARDNSRNGNHQAVRSPHRTAFRIRTGRTHLVRRIGKQSDGRVRSENGAGFNGSGSWISVRVENQHDTRAQDSPSNSRYQRLITRHRIPARFTTTRGKNRRYVEARADDCYRHCGDRLGLAAALAQGGAVPINNGTFAKFVKASSNFESYMKTASR